MQPDKNDLKSAQKNSGCTFSGCFPDCRQHQKLKSWVNKSYDLARQLKQIIARYTADALRRSLS